MTHRILIVLYATLFLLACEPVGQSLEQPKSTAGRVPTQESWNPTIRINSVGHENVQARAAYSAQYEDPQEIVFIGAVQLDFFDSDGLHSSMLSADSGNIDQKRNLFTARGNVVLESDSGMTLSTSILYWHESNESIYTDKAIVFTSETDTLYGIGFESEADLSNWTITQPTGVSYRKLEDD